MSSGSYFTIYRKHTGKKAADDVLEAVKEQYRASNRNEQGFSTSKSIDDFPVLMDASYKAYSQESCEYNSTYYDKEGYVYDKLLEFHFGSSFTCLKEEFHTDAYTFSKSAVLVSKAEAEKMLQAVEYLLSEEYSKKVESILSNKYIELFGRGLSSFDTRFTKLRSKMYIDKDGAGWTVSFGDYQLEAEIAECDDDIMFSLKRMRACFRAFLEAESYEWSGQELVLEYSTY